MELVEFGGLMQADCGFIMAIKQMDELFWVLLCIVLKMNAKWTGCKIIIQNISKYLTKILETIAKSPLAKVITKSCPFLG